MICLLSCVLIQATGNGLWIAGNDLPLFGTWLYEGNCKSNPVGFIYWGPGRPSGSSHCLELMLTTNGPYEFFNRTNFVWIL